MTDIVALEAGLNFMINVSLAQDNMIILEKDEIEAVRNLEKFTWTEATTDTEEEYSIYKLYTYRGETANDTGRVMVYEAYQWQ